MTMLGEVSVFFAAIDVLLRRLVTARRLTVTVTLTTVTCRDYNQTDDAFQSSHSVPGVSKAVTYRYCPWFDNHCICISGIMVRHRT